MIPVVALALIDEEAQRVLLHRRAPGKHHALLWEFPGGKVEPGEGAVEAMIREAREELGITLAPASLIPVSFAQGQGQQHLILLYAATAWSGTPVALEWPGDEEDGVGWFDADAMLAKARDNAMPPLDITLLQALLAWLAGRGWGCAVDN